MHKMSVRHRSRTNPTRKARTALRRQTHRVNKATSPALPPPPQCLTTTQSNTRRPIPSKVGYTTSGDDNATINWDSVSYVASDQKHQSAYSKPKQTVTGVRYGKLVTITTTTTVTTTIATTEILLPGEPGYDESRKRERTVRADPSFEKVYQDARSQAAGNRDSHESFHKAHHMVAAASPRVSSATGL